MKKDEQKSENLKQEINTGILSMGLFSLTAVIYFINAGYSYYKNIEGQVTTNIVLGIMFFVIGLTFLVTKNKN